MGLVAAAAVRIARPALKDRPAVLIALSAFLLSAFTDLHAVVIIGAGAAAGLAVCYLGAKRRAEVEHRGEAVLELSRSGCLPSAVGMP